VYTVMYTTMSPTVTGLQGVFDESY
jgi:hypothetical protein